MHLYFSRNADIMHISLNQGDEVLLKDTMEQCITLCDAVRFKIEPTIKKQ